MIKRLTIGIVVTIVVAIIVVVSFLVRTAFFDFANPEKLTGIDETTHNHHEHIHEEEVLVTYTETGFASRRIEVEVGTTVAFTNLTNTPMWVGSDPHPVHTDYPEFDASEDYFKDETYLYTFNEVGTFGFHNHKKSLHRGVVVVTDPETHTHDIDKTPENLRPVRDELIAMLDLYDPNTIFDVVDRIQGDPELSLKCHDIAHDLGHKAYELYGFSEAMTFNNPNHVDHPLVQYICAGGYMHGILEALSISQPDSLLSPGQICETMPAVEKDSCFHGVGHLFMLANERDIDEALLGCRLIEDDMSMYRCFEGIRMEQFWGNTDHVNTNTLGWDTEDPVTTCIVAKEDEKPTCFLYAPFGYLRENPKDYFGAVQFCMDPRLSRSDSSFCLKGLGITMMSKFQGRNLEGSEVYVTGLDADLKYAFYQGVLGYAQLSGKSSAELSATCGKFTMDGQLCYGVYQSMEPTFAAYEELNARRDALKNSVSVRLAREYIEFANERSLTSIKSMLSDETTYSSNDGVSLGVAQVMEAHRQYFSRYTSLHWDVLSLEEAQPGMAKVTFVFYGTTQNGTSVEESGTAYFIARGDTLQHIEVR